MNPLGQAGILARKAAGQLRLLWRDPERFGRNLGQYTNPADHLDRLLDVPDIRPLNTTIVEGGEPFLNVLLPAIGPIGMTGGPNTAVQIGCAIARTGTPVRFVSCDYPIEGGSDWFSAYLETLTLQPRPPNVTLEDTKAHPLHIGERDRVMATFWTTAHQANSLMQLTRAKRFLYLIQDFEPGFYPFSSRYALALETYGFAYHPIVNQAVLADYFAAQGIGNFAHPGFRAECITFEPALDRQVFKPAPDGPRRAGPRTLLVYARPSNARNMLGLAVAGLKRAIAEGAFEGDWTILAIGSRSGLPDIRLAEGFVMREAAWVSYQEYGRLLQQADILLCPMLSPHTSYPVLEMAACGGISVTTTFATKTAATLEALSPNIVAAEPSTRGIAEKLALAARMASSRTGRPSAVALPQSWDEALQPVVRAVARLLHEDGTPPADANPRMAVGL